MSTPKLLLIAAAVALALSAGCAETKQFKAVEQICVTNAEKTAAMQTGQDVLRQMNFVIDKTDAAEGVIRSKPLQGANFFELWRSDNVGAFNAAEANLHTIRRTAELKIGQQEGQLCIGCDVKVQRLNLPEQEISSSSQMPSLFSKSKGTMQKLRLNPAQKKGMKWVQLGRDDRLETEILRRIKEQMAR